MIPLPNDPGAPGGAPRPYVLRLLKPLLLVTIAFLKALILAVVARVIAMTITGRDQ
jgi:hypothetical protein